MLILSRNAPPAVICKATVPTPNHSLVSDGRFIFFNHLLLNRTYTNYNPNNLSLRTFYSGRQSNNLFSRITPLRDPDLIVPVLDRWVEEGRMVKYLELQRIIRDLRSRKRHSQALRVSKWMSSTGLCPFSPGDCAVQLDLIAVVHGLDAAESYFNNLGDKEKNDKTYGALLNCYVREGLVDKTLSLLQKMKEIGFASSPLVYNNLMCLYIHTSQYEKIPDLLSEMKKSGVSPNNFSYRICINSYGARSDLNSVEKLLEEMESQSYISMDWNTYSMVANFYIKAGLNEKALFFLKKLEEKLDRDALGYNHLIAHYANLGYKAEVMRLWTAQKVACKKQINRDYITILGSLVKLGDLEKAEALLKDWESSCLNYDFRVPNTLLIGYCQKGLIEKAEATLQDIIKSGKTPIPNSWAIIAAWYLDNENMEQAFKCMKEALAIQAENAGWRPKPRLISGILNWLIDEGKVDEVEAFVNSLKKVVSTNTEMYNTLIKENLRDVKVDPILESMKSENLAEDEEAENIL